MLLRLYLCPSYWYSNWLWNISFMNRIQLNYFNMMYMPYSIYEQSIYRCQHNVWPCDCYVFLFIFSYNRWCFRYFILSNISNPINIHFSIVIIYMWYICILLWWVSSYQSFLSKINVYAILICPSEIYSSYIYALRYMGPFYVYN